MAVQLAQGNVVENLPFLLVSSVNHIDPVLGATPTVTISKNGSAFAAPAGAITEIGNGWYQVAAHAADANTLGPLLLHATAAGADPTDQRFDVIPAPYIPPPPSPSPGTALLPAAGGPATFEALWKSVMLHTGAPAMLARMWCQDAYGRLTDMRPWTWTQLNAALSWQDQRTLSAVTTVRGSTTVTSAGLFLPEDAGRQFRVGTYPIYTIVQVPDSATIVLDSPFEPGGGADAVGVVQGQILDAYAVLPANFSAFTAVVDLTNQVVVPWWGTQLDIDSIDPMRTSGASVPRFLAMASPSTFPATLGQYRMEYWPLPEETGALNYYARAMPTQMSDQFQFSGVVAARLDVLRHGALAAAAKWPGTPQRKNPYFNLALARELENDFQKGALQLDLRDDDQTQQTIDNMPWQRYQGWSWAYDTRLLQMTDATLGDYFPGFLGAWA